MKLLLQNCIWLFAALALPAFAETSPQGSVQAGDHEIHYSVFPSTFLRPEVASAYGIKRSKYESLLNISVTAKGEYGGLSVSIDGTATNLLQQQKTLKFIEIKEKTATYYLAPVRISGEEILHFKVDATLTNSKTLSAKFSSKLVAQ